MSLPGLFPGLANPSSSLPLSSISSLQPSSDHLIPDQSPISHQHLSPESEFRFESSFAKPVHLKLLSGTAEIFGTELAPSVEYTFSGTKAAVFTWEGCQLEIKGQVANAYVAEEAPSVSQAANVHFALEDRRAQATEDLQRRNDGNGGPRVLLVGPSDVGKTSLAKTLVAYALKEQRAPTVVNLDPRQGLLSVPGGLTSTVVGSVLDVESPAGGWGTSPISGPSAKPVKIPLVYHYGCAEPDENSVLFKALVTRLALATKTRMEEDQSAKSSGLVIDTPGSLASGKPLGYELIEHIAKEFGIDVLLVIGSERLLSEMKRRFPEDRKVTVIKLERSGGCVDRDELYMRQLRQAQIREYFYGYGGEMVLSPFTQLVEYGQMALYQVLNCTILEL
jgi:polyribonucleotide 5'-hydroxyl-kinase